jgi:F-type H+-transporting ATPase subunit delta
MKAGRIAVRYAKALFLSAKEQGLLDEVRKDMELVLATVTGIDEVKGLLESPVVETRKKTDILVSLFHGRVIDLSLDFVRMVTANGREEYFDAMSRHYIKLYKEEKGIRIAHIETARPLTKDMREALISIIRVAFKADIELDQEVNQDIIGGFVLRVEDKQLDSSVKGKLARIKKELQN